MSVLQHRRAMTRLALLAATAAGIAACADQVAGPQVPAPSAVRPAAKAQHDDPPPDQPCITGWQDQSGIWVCPPG